MPRLARPTALTIPMVTVPSSPNGFPMASTTSATWVLLESPRVMVANPAPGSLSTATSDLGSAPMSLALNSRRSPRVTRIWSAPSTTWLLVSTYPSAVTITPEPRLRSRRGARSGGGKSRKNGSVKKGAEPPGPRTVFEEEMLTTAGIAAFATAVQPLVGAPTLAGTIATAGAERDVDHQPRASSAPDPNTRNPAARIATQRRRI